MNYIDLSNREPVTSAPSLLMFSLSNLNWKCREVLKVVKSECDIEKFIFKMYTTSALENIAILPYHLETHA